MTRLGARHLRNRDSILGIRKTSLFSSVVTRTGTLVPWGERQADEADHSPLSKVEFKKLWIYGFNPFCASMASNEQLCLDSLRGNS